MIRSVRLAILALSLPAAAAIALEPPAAPGLEGATRRAIAATGEYSTSPSSSASLSKRRQIDAGLDDAWFLLEFDRDPRAALIAIDAAIAPRRHPVSRVQRERAAAVRLTAQVLLGGANR